jgi:type IV pilus biogenesis protein CpaD/CtpE
MIRTLLVACSAMALAGCASSSSSSTPAKVTAATPQQNAALLDQVKQLAARGR